MKIHLCRVIERKTHTKYTSLCGRLNAKCEDGNNVTEKPEEVTCKFCIEKMKPR